MGIPHSAFEEKLEKLKQEKGVKLDIDLTASDLKCLVEEYKKVYDEVKGTKFPSGIALLHIFSFSPFLFLFQINCYVW